MDTFLVERYWPDIDLEALPEALARLDDAAKAMTDEGTPVGHLGTIVMPIDEVVFSLITAADETAVREVNQRARLPFDRISSAITLGPVGVARPTGGPTQ